MSPVRRAVLAVTALTVVVLLGLVVLQLRANPNGVASAASLVQPARSSTPPGHATAPPASTKPAATATTTPVSPLRVVATTPASTGAVLPATSQVTVQFSSPMAPSVAPGLVPATAGTWTWRNATTAQFTPSGALPPGASLALVVPGGASGVRAVDGSALPSSLTVNFTVQPGSTLRLQQLLAQLGYLPLTFTPAQPLSPVPTNGAAERLAAAIPPVGSFSWSYPNIPASLQALWQPGTYGVMTKGAVMAFERAHGLATDGVAGPKVWQALLAATAAGQSNTQGYSYALVSENSPETLTVWHNGQVVLTSLANTGISGLATTVGTFPIYLRYRTQTMQGVNPNGTPYRDPGIPYVNYFKGGEAIHGYVRASYGFPQSLGCVELPIPNAAAAWPWLHYGTLVTVQ